MKTNELKDVIRRIMADHGYENMTEMSISMGLKKSSIYNLTSGQGTGKKVLEKLIEQYPKYFESSDHTMTADEVMGSEVMYKKEVKPYQMTDQKVHTLSFFCEMLDMDIKYIMENKESIRKVLYKLSDMKMRIMKVEEILLN